MKLLIKSNFQFQVKAVRFMSDGQMEINLHSGASTGMEEYAYAVELSGDEAEVDRGVSLCGLAEEFADSPCRKSKTQLSYRHMLAHLRKYGDRCLSDVTTDYLQGFLKYLQEHGIGDSTARMYFQKLACILHHAYANEMFDIRILKRVRRIKRVQKKKEFLTERELGRLYSTPIGEKWENVRRMFLFSCACGLRFSDVSNMEWENIRYRSRHYYLHFRQQKTGTEEHLPLGEQAELIIRSLKHGKGRVFQEVRPSMANKAIQKWCKAAHIKKHVTFHTARHTFCVMLLTHGVPIYTVQQLMCHADISTTKVYADLANKAKRKAVCRLPVYAQV